MQTKIYCKTLSKGMHSFYLNHDGMDYFLFCQNYRKGVNDYYKNGVRFEEARDYSKAHHDTAIIRTMDKIPMYIKYIEEENNIQVMDKTKKKKVHYINTNRLKYIA